MVSFPTAKSVEPTVDQYRREIDRLRSVVDALHPDILAAATAAAELEPRDGWEVDMDGCGALRLARHGRFVGQVQHIGHRWMLFTAQRSETVDDLSHALDVLDARSADR